MFKKLVDVWEVAFLAKGGRLSNNEKLIVKDFAQWLEFEAAQQRVQPTVLNVREIETVCPNCNLVFDVKLPETHIG